MTPTIVAVCVSSARQKAKVPVDHAFLEPGGIRGDSHFGISTREVSMLRAEDILSAAGEAGFPFPPGSLAENIVVTGLPSDLPAGTVLAAGTASLRVVERGKRPGEPHSYDYRGYCLLPTVGFFLSVIKSGVVRPGDPIVVSEE